MFEVEDEVLPLPLPVDSLAGPTVPQQAVLAHLTVLVAPGHGVQRQRD